MWRVVLKGDDGLEYVYNVYAKKDAPKAKVEMAAFAAHGDCKKAGVVTVWANPKPVSIKYVP